MQRIKLKEFESIFTGKFEPLNSSGKFPLLVDTSKRLATFLTYRDVNLVDLRSSAQTEKSRFQASLVGAITNGKDLVLSMEESAMWEQAEQAFERIGYPGLLDEVISGKIVENDNYLKLFADGDEKKPGFREGFRLMVVCCNDPPESWKEKFFCIEVEL